MDLLKKIYGIFLLSGYTKLEKVQNLKAAQAL